MNTDVISWNNTRTFIEACLRLLYWGYFKPFTLQRYLQTIHPELKDDSNPFAMQSEWEAYPQLRQYATLLWWTVVAVPWGVTLLFGLLYTLISPYPFKWEGSLLFLVGWTVGNWYAKRGERSRLQRWILWFSYLAFFLLVLNGILRISPDLRQTLLHFIPGLWYDNIIHLIFSIGPIFSYLGILALIVVLGVVLGVVFGVAGGVALGVALGAALGVALGVALGAALGVTLGVTFILGVLRMYFWIPEFLWMIFVGTLSQFYKKESPHFWLPLLPFWYDQLIHLPLPFQAEIIAASYRTNPALAQRAITYLTTSTNQQGVASRAIIAIAINSLQNVRSVDDIAKIADHLNWIPKPPPAKLDDVLPQFVEISEGVRAALQATSTYRRYELLAIPLKQLQDLKSRLVFGENASLAPVYGTIVETWINLLIHAKQELEASARQSQEIPQAYIAGPALKPETAGMRFKGRQDIFHEIESLSLTNPPPVLLFYGGRRTGKTSTLSYLPTRTISELVPLLIDVQGLALGGTLPAIVQQLAKSILDSARRARNLNLPYPQFLQRGTPTFHDMLTWFGDIEKKFPQNRFVLCLDEFERLGEIVEETGSHAPLNFLRHVMQHREKWGLLFSGSHSWDDLPDYWSDYLINTRSIRISYLKEKEARELIQHPIPDFPDIYPPDVVDQIIRLTRCQPYLIQLYGSVLVDKLNQEKRRQVTQSDIATVIPIVFERGEAYFQEFWRNTLNQEERELLKALLASAVIEEDQRLILSRLVSKEVIEKRDGRWQFQIPLIRLYVEKRVSMGG